MRFDQVGYHVFAINSGVVGFFPEKKELASGRKSLWYWNGRRFSDYREPLSTLIQFIHDFSKDNDLLPDYFVNVPEGVNMVTCALNYTRGGKQVMARAKPKEHGDPKDRLFIGPAEKGDKVVVFEDVTTTGQSLVDEVKKCRDAGLDVIATLCECNRMEKAAKGKGNDRVDLACGVSDYLSREFGIRHYSMTDAPKILPGTFELWKPPEGVSKQAIADGLREEFRDHGVVEIVLKA